MLLRIYFSLFSSLAQHHKSLLWSAGIKKIEFMLFSKGKKKNKEDESWPPKKMKQILGSLVDSFFITSLAIKYLFGKTETPIREGNNNNCLHGLTSCCDFGSRFSFKLRSSQAEKKALTKCIFFFLFSLSLCCAAL